MSHLNKKIMFVCGQLVKLQAGFGAVTQLITQWRDENIKANYCICL